MNYWSHILSGFIGGFFGAMYTAWRLTGFRGKPENPAVTAEWERWKED